MKNNPKIDFQYINYSNNLFSKLQIVNYLTKIEYDKLNEKYQNLGLFIKQVKVDKYGNELNHNEILSNNDFLHKKRKRLIKKPKMTLQEFFIKYYCNNNAKKKKINNKIKKDDNSISNNSSESNIHENEKYNNEEIKQLCKRLKELYNDCQNIEMKKCKIEEKLFKDKTIEYIKRFSKFISNQQYTDLFNKWKNENWKIKGFNLLDVNNLNDWKIPILKAFKSEIVLLSFSNSLAKKIEDKDGNEEAQNINEERKEEINEEKKDEDNEQNEEFESESNSIYNYFQPKYILPNENDDNYNDEK